MNDDETLEGSRFSAWMKMMEMKGGFIAKLRRKDCVKDGDVLVLVCCDQVAESLARISLFGRTRLSRV